MTLGLEERERHMDMSERFDEVFIKKQKNGQKQSTQWWCLPHNFAFLQHLELQLIVPLCQV